MQVIIKAIRLKDHKLTDDLYSGFPFYSIDPDTQDPNFTYDFISMSELCE